MKIWLLLLLGLLTPLAAQAVNPEYENAQAYHSASAQNLSDSAYNTMTVSAADFTSPFFTISGGVFTCKVSGRYRITLQATATASCSSFIIYNGVTGIKAMQCRDGATVRAGGTMKFGYYEAGTSFSLGVLTVGGDRAVGQLTVELM